MKKTKLDPKAKTSERATKRYRGDFGAVTVSLEGDSLLAEICRVCPNKIQEASLIHSSSPLAQGFGKDDMKKVKVLVQKFRLRVTYLRCP